MNQEEYLNQLIEQIRCKQAREMVKEEMQGHIEDQTKAFIEMGMDKEEAIQQAVREMGDPIDAGVMLDRIHRPQMAWSVLILIGVISLISIFIQYLIYKSNTRVEINYFYSQIIIVVLGFLIMLATYFMDYSLIGRYAMEITAIFLLIVFIGVFLIGVEVNGVSEYIKMGPLTISLRMLMYLFAPMYGAILYQYRGEGYFGLLKAVTWMFLPIFIALRMPSASLAANLFLVSLIQLSVAIQKNWFSVKKKPILLFAWGTTILSPVIVLSIILNNQSAFQYNYQVQRIKNLISPDQERGYQIFTVRKIIGASQLIGSNQSEVQVPGYLPYSNSDYLITHIISYYGILAAIAIVSLLVVLILKMFKISMKQKNQLGMIMGLGCGVVFAILAFTFVLQNIGLYPTTIVFLPLFSFGATGTIVSYFMVGLLLSICRYQNIVSSKKTRRRKVKLLFVEE